MKPSVAAVCIVLLGLASACEKLEVRGFDLNDEMDRADSNEVVEDVPLPDADIDVVDVTGGDVVDVGDSSDLLDGTDLPDVDQSDLPDGWVPPVLDFAFVEVSAAAGLTGLQWVPPETLPEVPCGQSELHTGGAAIVDIDEDGWADVFLARMDLPNRLYRNQGDGTFVDIAPQLGLDITASSNGVLFFDADGDGDLDLLLTFARNEHSRLFINRGATFVDESATRLPQWNVPPDVCLAMASASAGDVDGDGDLDVFLSQWRQLRVDEPWQPVLLVNNGSGIFVDETDGRMLETWGDQNFVGSFADVNDDGLPELLMSSDWKHSKLWVQAADNTFRDVTSISGVGTDENGMGSAIGDIDGDGDLDWFVTAIYDPSPECRVGWHCSGNRLYLNRGNGTFEDGTDAFDVRSGGWGWGPAMFDVDNDGDLDLGMAAGYRLPWPYPALEQMVARFVDDPIRLWINGESLPMAEVAGEVNLVDDRAGKAFLPFDMDNDGDLDLLVTNTGDTVSLFRNDQDASKHWLVVRVRGTTNRFGLGAQVWVTPSDGDTPIRRDITGNSTFLGHGMFEAHFGLGSNTGPVYAVRVVWPDGTEQVESNVDVDRVFVIQK